MKKILAILTAALLTAAFAGCSNAAKESTAPTQSTTQAQTAAPTQAQTAALTQAETTTAVTTTAAATITEDEAKGIAVADAGFTLNQVNFTSVHSDFDDGMAVYEIEFTKDNQEYDYTIDAVSGAILEKETDSAIDD